MALLVYIDTEHKVSILLMELINLIRDIIMCLMVLLYIGMEKKFLWRVELSLHLKSLKELHLYYCSSLTMITGNFMVKERKEYGISLLKDKDRNYWITFLQLTTMANHVCLTL